MCCCNTKATALHPVTSWGRQPSWSRRVASAPAWSSSSTMSRNSQAAAAGKIDNTKTRLLWDKEKRLDLSRKGRCWAVRNPQGWPGLVTELCVITAHLPVWGKAVSLRGRPEANKQIHFFFFLNCGPRMGRDEEKEQKQCLNRLLWSKW